ncbi:MAG: GGDEF domain-containing protein [Desulfovibrionaceae bacterium]|nr:GGDEF domain-containing protein [Desulfovibrionaceae bacterium]
MLIFLFVAYTFVFFEIEPFFSYIDVIELLGIVLALPCFVLAIRAHRAEDRVPWIWFLLTAVLFLIGDALWAYISHTTGSDPESPSVCDVFYLTNTVTCVIGFFLFSIRQKSLSLTHFSLDSFISLFAAAGIIAITSITPIMRKEASTIAIATQICYPIGDILLVALLLILVFNSKPKDFFRTSRILMLLSFLGMFLTDQFSFIESSLGVELNPYFEPLWGTLHLLLAIAGLYDASEREEELKEIGEDGAVLAESSCDTEGERIRSWARGFEYVRIVLPYLLTFSVLAYIASKHKMQDIYSLWAIVLFILLCFRQVFVILHNRRLLRALQKSRTELNLKNKKLEQMNEKILHDAEIDFLTSLLNRRCIDEKCEMLKPKKNSTDSLGLLIIDVDFFKRVNDTYGHQEGDKILQKVAALIRGCIRGEDLAGRFGGDEFIVLLPGASHVAVEHVALRLIAQARADVSLKEKQVTLSIGGASWSSYDSDYTMKRLMKDADDALYLAKEGGRDRYVMHKA